MNHWADFRLSARFVLSAKHIEGEDKTEAVISASARKERLSTRADLCSAREQIGAKNSQKRHIFNIFTSFIWSCPIKWLTLQIETEKVWVYP